MKLVILSRKPALYSTRRLIEAAQTRGHEIEVINPLRCYINILESDPSIHYRGEPIVADAVIPRIGASITFYGTSVVRQFEMMGVFTLNESQAISRSRDKLRSSQLMARKGISLPITGFAHSPDDTEDLLKLVGGAPVVVKLLEGTQGMGVVLAETQNAADSVIDAFRKLRAYFLVQEYVKQKDVADIRCFVIGDKVIASMMRKAKKKEFRSNLHRGGTAQLIEATPEEKKMAVKAAQVMGLNVAGVDLMRSERGPLILEVNSSPGLQGIEQVSGIDIASLVIEFIENNSSVAKNRKRKD